MKTRHEPIPTIGWTEWIQLPDLHASPIRAKIDTGARTSALHAYDLEVEGGARATFRLSPAGRSVDASSVSCPVLGFRPIRSSNGMEVVRPVIATRIRLARMEWSIEVTLAAREEMEFRMLLGREAVRDRFLIHPGRAHLVTPRVLKDSKTLDTLNRRPRKRKKETTR